MNSTLALFSQEYGEKGKPKLVVLHGLLGSSRNWATAARGLAESFHVYALDLRNHGKSPHADSNTHEDMVGDVVAWLEAGQHSPVHLLGHSLGGKVAMRLACRRPELLESLCVVDIAPKEYRTHRLELEAMLAVDVQTVESRTQADERLVAAGLEELTLRQFLLTNLVRVAGGFAWQPNLQVLLSHVEELARSPLGPDDHFSGEALFIIGDCSPYVTPTDGALIRDHFLAAEIVSISDCGHNPHYEKREEFVAVLCDRLC